MLRALRLCVTAFTVLLATSILSAVEPPRTVAETSDYKATSKHADVVAFCEQLAKAAPTVVRLSDLGNSGQGRKIPLLIVADPPVATPEEATRSGKLVVFAQGNIHAGEVDGKEGLLMLARDLALAKERPLLKDLIFAVAPIVNPDGNEPMAKNRPWQAGPDLVGIRENAAGFDLNRDFIRLQTPEVQALVRFYRRWNPAVVIDAHTTNGSLHRYAITYDGPHHPATSPNLVAFIHDVFLPNAGKRLEKTTGFASFFYGNFRKDHAEWEGFPPIPRTGTHYMGLRGRIGLLSESYVYLPFAERVKASREFVLACLEVTVEHKEQVRKLLAEAQKPSETVALQFKVTPRSKPATVLGYEEIEKDGKRVAGKPKEYTVTRVDAAEASLRVARPVAYLIPASLRQVTENLQRHGVTLDELREDIELDCEGYTIDKVVAVETGGRNRPAARIEATRFPTKARRFEAGTVIVHTAQTLGNLATYLLEPQADDSLAAWGLLGNQLAAGKEYPIAMLTADIPITSGRVRPLAEDRVINKRITPEDAAGFPARVSFGGNAVRGLQWLPDGEHYLQVKRGKLLKISAATGRMQVFFDSAKVAAALTKVPGLDARVAQRVSTATNFRMNPQMTGFLFENGNDLYFATFDGSQAIRLTNSAGAKELITFSPNGQWVAFVRDSNLFAVDLATQTERKLTADGGGKISNGKADWVYYEEIFNRSEHAFWWSPDAKHVAFLRFDDAPVAAFTVVDQIPVRQRLEQTPYPKAGDPNPVVKLGIAPSAGGPVRFAELEGYKADAILLIRAAWQPDGQRVLLYVQDRAQTWLDVWAVPVDGGKPAKLFRDSTKAWVEDPGDPMFLRDGSFLFFSERSGWKHLYHYDKNGSLLRQVTEGNWEVRQVHRIDEDAGAIFISATRDSVIGSNLYRCPLVGGGEIAALTSGGNHQVNMAAIGPNYLDTFSSFTTPTKVRLSRVDGRDTRWLDTNPVYATEEYRLGKSQLVRIPMKDGFVLEGSVLLPVDFDSAQRYPVWFMTYAGPHFPTISDSFGARISDHVLSGLGIIVFRCDPRSASGKGAVSAWSAYRQLGVQELKDIEEAIDWLTTTYPCVDKSKIGMSGHSYGGFMTAYAMTHSKKFCAGIAGAPVTDWKNYDTIYTERYMNTPKENADGYAKTSVVRAAKNLHGRLLILHGLMDDNVHVQNTVQFIDELQRANKDFELMFYPRARHGIGGAHYQRLMLEFIRKSMGK